MKKRIVCLLVLLMIVGLAGAMPVAAADPADPVLIGTAAELTEFATKINNGELSVSTNAKLTDNIVLRTDAGNWASWGSTAPDTTTTPAWTPIGKDVEGYRYNGTFDGDGHTVSGIYINATLGPQGLFGTVENQAKIKNLGVINSWINGTGSDSDIGGIVGRNYGSVSNCYNAGKVNGRDNAGGVVGQHISGTITNCYNTGTVSGNNNVGGLTGSVIMGGINNCYNTGNVSNGTYVGGVAGYSMNATNCYYLKDSAAFGIGGSASDPPGATVKTVDAFVSGEVAWLLQNGQATQVWGQKLADPTKDLLPVLTNVTEKKVVRVTLDYDDETPNQFRYCAVNGVINLPTPAEGTIYTYTQADGTILSQTEMTTHEFGSDETVTVIKYQLISTPAELIAFSAAINDGTLAITTNARLTENIVLNAGSVSNWESWSSTTTGLVSWTPIGKDDSHKYNGTFDGAGYTVSGIYINASDENPQGLFGRIDSLAEIKNLGVINSWINGTDSSGGIGGIVGQSYGSVSNCYNTGTVSKGINVGGVVGRNTNGTISNCYNTGTVSGGGFVGGVVGQNSGSITNCFNTGTVSGSSNVGGVAGSAMGGISNCYYQESPGLFENGDFDSEPLGSTAAKSTAAFASGEVAWLLQNGQTDSAVQVWGQKLVGTPADATPLLKSADPICKITYLQGDGTTTFKVGYANQNQTITPVALSPGYIWKDSNQDAFTGAIPTVTALSVHCGIATLPTATAHVETKLRDIPFTGGSVDVSKWEWSESDANLNLVLAFGNTTAYKATYTSDDSVFGTVELDIIPTITKRLTDAGVTISLAADSYTATGAAITPVVTVIDAGTTLTTADYTVIYTNNINPGTATITITGQGNYTGTVTKNFTITSSGGGGYTPPVMPGVVVNPGTITFDPAGNLAVDITGAPAGSVVYYSLDGITFTTTPPAMENAGEHTVYVKVTSPGYQDYITQTTVTVEKHEAPVIPQVSVPVLAGQQSGSTDLGALLPPNRGQIRYQLVSVNDPREILSGPPTIDQNGMISYGFTRPRSASGEQLTASATTDNATSSATITVLVTMENYADTTIILVVSAEEAFGVQYQTHIQDIGWETDWKTDGELSGTEGQSKRLEALKVELTGDVPAGATIDTEVHVQNYGNMGPFAMGAAAGTSGEGLRLENICLTLKNLPGYTILYDVHVQNQGWLRDENDASTWFKSGETAGTSALSLRLEGIRIKLVKSE